jgi:hypothetical protein
VSGLLPYVVGAVGYFAGGYQSTHKATVSEIAAALADASAVIALVEHVVSQERAPDVADPKAAGN